jgi:ABC-2 type transport system permease protein
MLVLFATIFGSQDVAPGVAIKTSTYYVANQVAFGVVDAGFMALTTILVNRRQAGLYKRRRATPVPAWAIVVSQALLGLLTALGIAVLLLLVGEVFYSASLPASSILPLSVTVLIGALSFCSLGFAAASLVRTVDAAQPVATGIALPLFFISGVFIPWVLMPSWLRAVALVFPVRGFAPTFKTVLLAGQLA